MKFTDGYWQSRPDVTPYFPIHVHDVVVEPEALTIYGATKRIMHRGDTFDARLLTVRFSSPLPDVIRVEMTHHKGQRPASPSFPLYARRDTPVTIAEDEAAATLTSGGLTVRIRKGENWQIDFSNGRRRLTGSG